MIPFLAPALLVVKPFFARFWREILIICLVVGCLGGTYHIGKVSGERKAQEACVEKFQQYEKALDDKITGLSKQITLLVDSRDKGTALTKADLDKIYQEVKDRKLIVVEGGKCTLTPDFQTSFNEIIERANKK
jgi:hypothetical protein